MRIRALVTAGLLAWSYGTAVHAESKICIVETQEFIYRSEDHNFDAAREQLNAMLEGNVDKGKIDSPSPRLGTMPQNAEIFRIDLHMEDCAPATALTARAGSASKACREVGCVEDFPGFNSPVGTKMTISGCGGGVSFRTEYVRTENGWRVTKHTEEAVVSCPPDFG